MRAKFNIAWYCYGHVMFARWESQQVWKSILVRGLNIHCLLVPGIFRWKIRTQVKHQKYVYQLVELVDFCINPLTRPLLLFRKRPWDQFTVPLQQNLSTAYSPIRGVVGQPEVVKTYKNLIRWKLLTLLGFEPGTCKISKHVRYCNALQATDYPEERKIWTWRRRACRQRHNL